MEEEEEEEMAASAAVNFDAEAMYYVTCFTFKWAIISAWLLPP